MTLFLVFLACTTPQSDSAPDATPIPSATVAECTPGVVASVEALGPVWSVAVTLPNGAAVAPMVQIFSDKVDVYCPKEGGTITVEWGD